MTVQAPRASAAHPVVHEHKSALARWSLRASLAGFLYSVGYIVAAVVFYQAGFTPPPWAPVALAIGPGIGLILAGGGTALNLGEMLLLWRRIQEFNPREAAREFALDDASELLGSMRQGCLARAVVPLALIFSMVALLVQVLSLSGGGDALQVALKTPPQSCVVSLVPFTLELDNSSSAVAVPWSASPVETLRDGTPWAQVQPAQGTVQAGQRAQVAVIPNALVCQFLARTQPVAGGHAYAVLLLATDATYHVQVTSSGRTRRTTTLAMQIAGGTPLPTPTVTPTPSPTPARKAQSTPGATATSTSTSPPPPPPRLAVSPTQATTVTCSGSSVPYPSIAVRNVGGQALSWNAGATVASASVTPSSGRLGQGQSQQLTVTQPGPINTATNVTITSNGGNAVVRFTCAAPGLHGNLVVNPTTLALGNYCGDSFSGVGITLSNTGNGPLTWSQSAGSGFSLAPSSGTLNAGASLGVGVSGTKANASFGIAWQGGSGGGTNTVAVSTSCVAPPPPPPQLTVNPTSVSLGGACGSSATVSLGNTGGQTLTWSIDSSGGNGATASPASGSIAPGKSIAVTVSGGPIDPSLQGNLLIYSNGGNASITVQWGCPF